MQSREFFLVGNLGRPPAELCDKPIDQKNTAEAFERPAAKASCEAPLNHKPEDRSDEAAIDPCLSASEEEWQAAFPGQAVHRRIPNRQRIAMHLAKAMCRAVVRGDFEVAVVYFDRLHGVPRSTKGIA